MFNRKMLYMTHPPQNMRGITLIEVSVVLLILVALAGLGLPYVRSTIDDSECSLTDVTLQNVKSAIMGSPTAPGFVGDMNRMPYNLEELTTCPTYGNFACVPPATSSYNPSSQSGWRGPYVSNSNPIPNTNPTFTVITDQFKSPTNYPALSGSPIQLALAFDGTNCSYFLLSNGPNGNPDIAPIPAASLPAITYASAVSYAPGCYSSTKISPNTMSYLANANAPNTSMNNLSAPPITGLGTTPQYLNISGGINTWTRGDDRLLFIESVDPGSNTPCNQ